FDLAILVKTGLLDFKFIEDKLKEINLLDFAKKCFSLVEKWFKVEIKIEKEEISEEFNDEAITLLINNGVFGFNDKENKNNYVIYQISKNKKITKKKRILLYIFPPYRLMKEIPYYSFVNGKPFLMPIAWIYRVFRIVFKGKAKESIKSIKRVSNITNEQIEKRLETLKKWGI
ncbi:MAG: hypothetical protein KBS91_04640, partial [Firmicutes bacterium]|nr:hypothetical protein [Candidatus Caballimonas caccae]